MIDTYDYDEYVQKFDQIWKISRDELEKALPNHLLYKLDDYHAFELPEPHLKSKGPLSFLLFSYYSICQLSNPFSRKGLLNARDFHIIRQLGNVSTNQPGRNRFIYNYVVAGEALGESPNDRFDPALYLANNPDLAGLNMGLYAHFLMYAKLDRRNIEGLE
jgi:hypothetical protein